MEDYRLEQSGQEVQNILDGAAMQSDLTAETERAELAEQTLQGNIDIEERDRKAADLTLQGNIDAEELRAKAAEKQNADDIDALEEKVPSAATSENKLTDKEYVDGQVDDEKNRAQGVEGTLQDNIDAEETRAKAAEKQNADDIDAIEEKIPSGASSANKLATQSDVSDEEQARQQADQALQGNIDAEELRAKAAEKQNADDIDAIEEKIPSGASSSDKLATESYVNDKVATDSATFRGTVNLVSDLGLVPTATHNQIAAALLTAIATADNNDYCFVQVPTSSETPTEIQEIDRYKFNGTVWSFEYELNNSGFSTAQWAAINSGITSGDVTKLGALPTNAELTTLLNGKQDVLTFDNVPTEGSSHPVKSGGVYSAIDDEKTARENVDSSLSSAIEAILLLIPSAATSLNKLADKAFVNSSISTASATFRGTYNLVNDLSLMVSATHAQIATALAGAVSDEDNNDYAFVQIPTSDATPTQIAKTERYKYNGTIWEYEYDLNNSGYTAAQWAAINSGITEALVTKLSALPTNAELTEALGVLTSSITTINQKIPSAASQANQLVDTAAMESYIVQVLDVLTASFNVTSTDGHVTVSISQVDGKITSVAVSTSDIASVASLSLIAGRVTTAEENISTNAADIANLQDAYAALTQSALVVVQPTDTWPVASPATSTIYRVVDRVNTPPQYYSDYMWNGTTMVLMATYNNAIDDVPTPGSNNLVKSGGVASSTNRQIYTNNAVLNSMIKEVYFDENVDLTSIVTCKIMNSSYLFGLQLLDENDTYLYNFTLQIAYDNNAFHIIPSQGTEVGGTMCVIFDWSNAPAHNTRLDNVEFHQICKDINFSPTINMYVDKLLPKNKFSGNNVSYNKKFNLWGSELANVVYGKKLRWLENGYLPVTQDNINYAYTKIELSKIICDKLIFALPKENVNGQYVVFTDEAGTDFPNVDNYAFDTSLSTRNPHTVAIDSVKGTFTFYVNRAKSLGYKTLYVSCYNSSDMYIYAEGITYDWITPDNVVDSLFKKLSFESVNIYKTKYTNDVIGKVIGYDITTYEPDMFSPDLSNQDRSYFVCTEVNIENVPYKAFSYEIQSKTAGSDSLIQAIIISSETKASNYTYTQIETAGFNLNGISSDGETVLVNVSALLEKGYNKFYISHVYKEDFAINATNVSFPWIANENTEILPIDTLYHVVDSSTRLFIKNVLKHFNKNMYYNKTGVGSIGSRYIDYGDAQEGNSNTRIEAYGSDEQFVAGHTFKTKSIVATAKSGQSLDVIMIGDSTTDAGIITAQLINIANKGGLTLNMLGTRQKTVTDSDNNQRTVLMEGRSGWSSYDFLHTESYNGSTNAFLNNGLFDFSYYMQHNNFNSVDWVTIALGINDTWRPMNGTTTDENIEDMIDSIKQYNNSIKIGVALVIPPYMGINHPMNTRDAFKQRYAINEALIEKFKNIQNVFVVPINACIDTDYGFRTQQTAVGDWIDATETIPIDTTHPANSGYYQIADQYLGAILAN